jgi:hypothetical protein
LDNNIVYLITAPANSDFTGCESELGKLDQEKWVVFVFYDHTPLGERNKMAEDWKRKF